MRAEVLEKVLRRLLGEKGARLLSPVGPRQPRRSLCKILRTKVILPMASKRMAQTGTRTRHGGAGRRGLWHRRESLTIDHRPSTIEHRASSIDYRLSTIEHRASSIEHRPSTIDHRPSTIDHRPPSIDHRPSTTEHRPPSIEHRPPTTDHRPPTTDHRPPTINHQPSTINHQPGQEPVPIPIPMMPSGTIRLLLGRPPGFGVAEAHLGPWIVWTLREGEAYATAMMIGFNGGRPMP